MQTIAQNCGQRVPNKIFASVYTFIVLQHAGRSSQSVTPSIIHIGISRASKVAGTAVAVGTVGLVTIKIKMYHVVAFEASDR